jgi:hypothetical protein
LLLYLVLPRTVQTVVVFSSSQGVAKSFVQLVSVNIANLFMAKLPDQFATGAASPRPNQRKYEDSNEAKREREESRPTILLFLTLQQLTVGTTILWVYFSLSLFCFIAVLIFASLSFNDICDLTSFDSHSLWSFVGHMGAMHFLMLCVRRQSVEP